jgi:cyclopropane fatty-acyl-phospholipid synthase-like methyltransferase
VQLSDALWTDKWSKVYFTPRPEDFSAAVRKYAAAENFMLFGTDEEPGSSLWMASLSEAMGENFKESMAVLDYGCGAGRYAQFLRQRLRRFEYYGLEKPGSCYQHGEKSIRTARKLFRCDRRIRFDLIGSRLESKAIARASVAVLGSIFTHVDFDELQSILKKLQPIVSDGGKVVFSIFLADTYRLEDEGIYGQKNCYNRVWFTGEQLERVCHANDWAIVEMESFVAQEVNVHRIFALTHKG